MDAILEQPTIYTYLVPLKDFPGITTGKSNLSCPTVFELLFNSNILKFGSSSMADLLTNATLNSHVLLAL